MRLYTEREIRRLLVDQLLPHGLVVEEVAIDCHRVVADVVLINDGFHAYEIKSDKDNLKRLDKQLFHYSKTCNTVTVVTGPKLYEKVLERTPKWVGIMCMSGDILEKERAAKENPSVCGWALLDQLWVAELKAIHRLQGFARYASLNKYPLIKKIQENFTSEQVQALACEQLRQRKWKAWR